MTQIINVYHYKLHICILSSTDRPSPPEGPLLVSEITKESCRLTWKLPQDDDGGCPILHYAIEKMDVTRGTWSDAGTCAGLTSEVNRLTHKKEYLFRVRAVNSIGESEPLELGRSIIAKNECGMFHLITTTSCFIVIT